MPKPQSFAILRRVLCIACLVCAGSGVLRAAAEVQITFPDDAGVIDVTKAPYNSKPDGTSDCTDAIQKALDDHPANNRIIYLPNGTYLVSNTIEWPPSRRLKDPERKTKGDWGEAWKMTILQGQSRSKTVIKLKDACPGFQETGIADKDIAKPIGKPVVWTGDGPAQRFRNAVRNLTIHTGKGNPGATGLQFNASNQGGIDEVSIVSGDGQGAVGLDIGFAGDAGPGCARRFSVSGFDYGIWSASMNSFTIWDVALKGQKKAGIKNSNETLMIHNLKSENSVPALIIGPRWSSFVTLIDAQLTGGAKDQPAILIDGGHDKHLFARSVKVAGYELAVKAPQDAKLDAKGDIDEYSYGPITKAFPDCAERTLNLPVKWAPEVPWGDIKKDWANVMTFGAKGDGKSDDTEAVQKAIDSGATTVYFPGGKNYMLKDVSIRGKVQRLIACEAYVTADHIFVDDGTAPAVIIERFIPFWNTNGTTIVQRSKRPLVVSSLNGSVVQESLGDVFVEDVCGTLFMNTKGARAWCRYLNYEPSGPLGLVNKGGVLWVMGSKTEHPGPKAAFSDGSMTELLGAFWYGSFGEKVPNGITVTDSAVSIVGHRMHSFGSGEWKPWVHVERKGASFDWTGGWAMDFLSIATPADLEAAKKLHKP